VRRYRQSLVGAHAGPVLAQFKNGIDVLPWMEAQEPPR